MIVGVPKEVKDHESRVGLVPGGVVALREAGHEVLVETHAGVGTRSRTGTTSAPARRFSIPRPMFGDAPILSSR